MSDKDVAADGAGSIAVGGSVTGGHLRAQAHGGTPPREAAALEPIRPRVHATAAGAIAIGGDVTEASISTSVGEGAGSDEEPVVFPELDEPVDLILRIAREPNDTLRFDARTRDRRQLGPFRVQVGESKAFASKIAGFAESGGNPETLLMEMRHRGAAVAALLPDAALKELLEGRLGKPNGKPSILILTDDDYIPWELAFLQVKTAPRGAGFLGELAEIGRWPIGRGLEPPVVRAALGLFNVFAASSYANTGLKVDLPNALVEREFLVETFGAVRHEADLNAFQDWPRWPESDPQSAHIAVHGNGDPVANEHELILADGRRLTPALLAGMNEAAQRRTFSLVFLNACQAGAAGATLGRPGGFTGTLTQSANAVIAPLWQIDDRHAREFAESFYLKTLDEGLNVGRALATLRSRGANLTCLSYVFFGHPLLKLTLEN